MRYGIDRGNHWLRFAALLSIASIVVGCGIAGQSPTAAPASGTTAPSATTTATGGASPTGGLIPTASTLPSASPSAEPSPSEPATPQPTIAGTVVWNNWPFYIDVDEENEDLHPSLATFTEQTGIEVVYPEKIGDNSELFGEIQPDLAAGRSTGYDVITPSDWMVAKLIRLGYLQPLDKSLLPNFTANAQEQFLNPWYDPGNVYSVPYQAGIVGIGYNPKLTGREITTFDDLLDPAFKGEVGMFSEMIDTMSLTLLSLGVDPPAATMADVQAAHDKLLAAAQAGQFQDFYGNDYYEALAGEDIALTMAWSGDISQMQINDNPDVKFVIPDTGGLLFVDNMVLPKVVDHPADAHKLIDFYYTLDGAVPLSEWVGYFSPVKGVREAILEDVQEYRDDGDDESADYYEQVARDVFPDAGQLDNIHQYKQLTEDEERQWNELFNEIVNG